MAKVPPNGYSFDVVTGKLKYDLDDMRQDEQEDARLARILQQVANNVQTGIEMESDYPSKNRSQKLAILDMEVWVDPENRIVYQHYEKQVASKNVLSAKSAQSSKCKRNVHVQEVVRRLVNTSTRIDWENITPVLSNYMKRMQIGGYNEGYRKTTLKHALEIYDRKLLSHETGHQPLNRPRCWQEGERRREKRKRRNNWSAKGGCIAPIFVPATPGSELANELRAITETESLEGLKFKIVETGGMTIKNLVQKSNPTRTAGCSNEDCLACSDIRGGGGDCLKSNVTYELECKLCPGNEKCIYVGETSRNLYTRAKEHYEKYKSVQRNHSSFIKQHQVDVHEDQPAEFKAKMTGSFRDCLSRQVTEAVLIRRSDRPILNTKSEWHQPALWRVQHELVQN